MSRRLTTGLLLLMALCFAPLRAPVQACGMSTAGGQKMACKGCCANMKSCVLPQRNPSDATTAPSVDTVAVTLTAPAIPVLLQGLFPRPISFASVETQRVATGSSRLAVFCAFLI